MNCIYCGDSIPDGENFCDDECYHDSLADSWEDWAVPDDDYYIEGGDYDDEQY